MVDEARRYVLTGFRPFCARGARPGIRGPGRCEIAVRAHKRHLYQQSKLLRNAY